MGLEVIGAGFGRTGTMSLKAALEELGFDPCYHMSEVFDNPEHIETWDAAATGKTRELATLLARLPGHRGLARLLVLRGADAKVPRREGPPKRP